MARVLVLEPWYGGSHRAWLDSWRAHSRHDITIIAQADEFWRWRMRAGAVEVAARANRLVAEHGAPDVVVTSSLLDTSVFAGLTRRTLGQVPLAVYMHENQLLYPRAPNARRDDDAALANWRSLLAADAIWWNSDFHRDALLTALPDLLGRQPEPVAAAGTAELRRRSTVLAPGVPLVDLIEAEKPANAVPVVLWNQRWDHDKNPHAVFDALGEAARRGIDFEVTLAGENHRHSPDVAWAAEQLGGRVRHSGHLPPDRYRRALIESDVVISAADHEFFGIAIVEAIAAGAVPVLPDRLSFPGLVGEGRGAVLYPDGQLRSRVASVLGDIDGARADLAGLRESMARFDVRHTAAAHDAAVDALTPR